MPLPVQVLCSLTLVGALAAQGYTTNFDSFTASATGTPTAGQDGFYVPAVAGSIDGNLYTYAGNPLGVPVNANGGANFWAGTSGGGTAFARSQRAVTLPTGRIRIQYDVCCNYIGAAVTPTNNIGSFSFQPSTNSTYVNLLAAWPVGVTYPPTTWDANVVTRGVVPGTVTTVLPNPAFQGLALGVWHTWSCVVDMVTGEHVEFSIKNGVTGVTTTYVPATPLLMPTTSIGAPMPTDFRLFGGGGLGNVFAIDNLRIDDAPATVTVQGEGAPFAHSFYESFATAAAFDLAGRAITMTPAPGGRYLVTSGGAMLPLGAGATTLALTDDSETFVPFTTGSFPGWTGVQVCSNGFISQAGPNGTGFSPSVATFLGAAQTSFRSWHDYNPAIVGSGQVKVEQSATVTTVTWDNVYNFGQASGPGSTFQFQLYPSGVVTIVWASMNGLGNGHLVGFSPGGASVDPGNADLSGLGSITLDTTNNAAPLRLTAAGRPVQGAAPAVFSVTTRNVPSTAIIHLGIIGLSNPNLPLFSLGMPDCTQYVSLDSVNAGLMATPAASTFAWSLTIPALPLQLSGLTLYMQSAILGTSANTAYGLGAVTSNGLKCVIGYQ